MNWELSQDGRAWLPARVPSTVASCLREAELWSLDGPARRFDAEEWQYRARFPGVPGEETWLCLDGLATVAEVWLNGELLLTSESMFVAHELRIDQHALRPENELVLKFKALDPLLAMRRPRPRWRTPMVEHQQLRWFRTTLLGRTPGWSPPAAAVGPWRDVRLERRCGIRIADLRLSADGDGRFDIACRAANVASAEIVLARGGREWKAPLACDGGRVHGTLHVPDVERWWPHTHGEPALYTAKLRLDTTDIDLGKVGFRTITLDTSNDGFALLVNGVPVFCRGACWMPLDPVSLASEPEALARAFAQVTGAGMNMLRVSGTTIYESDAFLDACDTHGVLLWQDFMFASMDYPEDAAFGASVQQEAKQLLARMHGRPSLAVLCGNSEGEQQAAMWGATRERWQPQLFHETLGALAREARPDVPYWPSSAHGGAFPHQANAGSCSYYGVGAYLRPLDDARRAEVRFASECLAFANIGTGPMPKAHDAAWKARSPRDLGAGWDFDDVRDHYVARLFRVDPTELRRVDHERYLELGRVATGEVMANVFAEWRRKRSPTRGGLVWFLRDLWAGAGWGVIDANGTPKAAWHYLRRALAPVAMSISDEGCNGVAVHVLNDLPSPLHGEIELALYRGDLRVDRAVRPCALAPHDALELNAGAFFDGFHDLSYAYRFGPPSFDLLTATLRDARSVVRARAFHCVNGLPNTREQDLGLTAEVRDDARELVVRTRRFAHAVRVEMAGFVTDDNWFCLAPGEERRLVLTGDGAVPLGTVHALNAERPATIVAPVPCSTR